jgi:H+/Cl- antiporter ClcA
MRLVQILMSLIAAILLGIAVLLYLIWQDVQYIYVPEICGSSYAPCHVTTD